MLTMKTARSVYADVYQPGASFRKWARDRYVDIPSTALSPKLRQIVNGPKSC